MTCRYIDRKLLVRPKCCLQEQYERPQQSANVRMTAALDTLQRVFQPQTGWTASLRGVGLGLIHESPLLKSRIMQYAMGS